MLAQFGFYDHNSKMAVKDRGPSTKGPLTNRPLTRRTLADLGSRDRSGGHARRVAFNSVRDFVRPNLAILSGVILFPGTIGYVSTLFFKTSENTKWLYRGISGISGFWLVVILVITWTGIGNPLMGLDGENRTAEVLRKFRKNGWQLVNGLKLYGDWDIDHVLIGPSGVLVLESKWSHKEWPSDDQGKTFMAGRLEDAVRQVLRNNEKFRKFFKEQLVGVTVTPVCVLWSHAFEPSDLTSFQTNGVVVVSGPKLETWMQSLTSNWLDSNRVERITNALANQIEIRDKSDAEKLDAPLPTFGTLVSRNVLVPLLGFMISLYGFALITKHQPLWVIGLAVVAFIIIGIVLTKKRSLRKMGRGWLGAVFLCTCFFVIALIQLFTR